MEGVASSGFLNQIVSSNYSSREKVGNRVWDWRAFGDWKPVIWSLISQYVDDKVIEIFMNQPPEYVVGDDLSWLEARIDDAGNGLVDIKAYLNDQLLERYDCIRSYHGARPLHLESYYESGLQPLRTDHAKGLIEDIFLNGDFPELTQGVIAKAIEDVGPETREGRVYFEANERLLVEQCGHYMLYGSEYIIAVAAHLQGDRNYRPHLKTIGTPTVFLCDVPLRMLHPATLASFAGMALEFIFSDLIEGNFEPSWSRGAGFSIRELLRPEYIVGHYHPDIKRDPFAKFEATI